VKNALAYFKTVSITARCFAALGRGSREKWLRGWEGINNYCRNTTGGSQSAKRYLESIAINKKQLKFFAKNSGKFFCVLSTAPRHAA